MATVVTADDILCQAAIEGGGLVTWATARVNLALNDTQITMAPETVAFPTAVPDAVIPAIFETADVGQTVMMVAIDGGGGIVGGFEIAAGGSGLLLHPVLPLGGATTTCQFTVAITGAVAPAPQTTAQLDLDLVVIIRN
jgi:hypothetical protein